MRSIKKQKMLNKNAISTFFALLFLFSVLAPSMSQLLGYDDDIVCIVDVSELESKEKKPINDKENKIINLLNSNLNLIDSKSLLLEEYYFNTYTTPNLNLISPPPEYLLS